MGSNPLRHHRQVAVGHHDAGEAVGSLPTHRRPIIDPQSCTIGVMSRRSEGVHEPLEPGHVLEVRVVVELHGLVGAAETDQVGRDDRQPPSRAPGSSCGRGSSRWVGRGGRGRRRRRPDPPPRRPCACRRPPRTGARTESRQVRRRRRRECDVRSARPRPEDLGVVGRHVGRSTGVRSVTRCPSGRRE